MIHRLSVAAALSACIAGTGIAQTAAPFEMPRADAPPPALPTPGGPGTEGRSGFDALLDNLLGRAQPHLEGLARDMGGLMAEYSPVLEELGTLMDDIGNYDLPPERLPNGDILIRRKAAAPPPPPLEQLPRFIPDGPGPADPALVPPAGPQTEL
ncbi:hypothetical protein [Paracoccus contaminans]|uniref:AAA+ family ATPase n=1 Tax=Paracoccus contaminans TaxID=1945662 RepID=A0A1W6CZE6_9RHOB|nr:hypothetical protein [Paracoccus contaminans]ARJ70244.1 hypothetical protein B0A89_12035 [Paracoccus contaminans]